VYGSLLALAAPVAVPAQGGKVWRVGVLLSRYGANDEVPQGLRQRLIDLGYIEGQNLVIEWRAAEGGYGRISDLAADLVRRKVDVLITDTAVATREGMKATRTIPIVTALAADPVGDGLVASVARPGGNVTGISLMLPELSAKRLELLKDAVPKLSRVAVLWNPGTPWHTTMLRKLHDAAPSMKVEITPIAVEGPADFEATFAVLARGAARRHLLGRQSHFFRASETTIDPRHEESPTDDRVVTRVGGLWWPAVLWTDLHRNVSECRRLCG